jgi:NADH-quinone oxidoreductase subunit A
VKAIARHASPTAHHLLLQFAPAAGRASCRAGIDASKLMLQNYVPILIFLGVALVLGSVLIGLGFFLGPRRPDAEKLSAYECGFEAFSDSRMKFDVRYYLVAILFIVFDLEIAFLFPWAVALGTIGKVGLAAMGIFLAILVVGFVYEWKKGALEWD